MRSGSINWPAGLCLLLLLACHRQGDKRGAYSFRLPGYYYQLLAFNTDQFSYKPGHVAWLSVTFATQADSVFWDSGNNLNDRFFSRVDSSASDDFIRHFVSRAAAGDSACLLIKPGSFFSQQFGSAAVPFFSEKDSVVKVNLKLKTIFEPGAFEKKALSFEQEEAEQTLHFFGSEEKMMAARDPLGFYWIDRPGPSEAAPIAEGDLLTLAYRSYFLNGRVFENPVNNFEYIYGTPDQLIKGLNYVSGKLKLGQTSKILLPSRLAFGENGSSNGSVPLFTPLIYELKIIDVKKTK